MQTVSCPSCGAPVEFRSHASVMAICGYCQARVVKEADAVKDLGKISGVLEDYSPIQVGTSGEFRTRQFTVAGRIQLRYDHGMWNEWYIVFDDGSTGWLGDASGEYMVTIERKLEGVLPPFEQIEPGRPYGVGKERFIASDKRVAQCVGGQGELPFRVGDGWQARVADLRAGARFVTLDYSEAAPVVYDGYLVTLPGLRAQLLRDADQVKESAGRYRGKVDALDCPSCGSPIAYVPGVTTTLVCGACARQVDASTPQAKVLAAGSFAKVETMLQLGDVATINMVEWRVIGAMQRKDEENERWIEYLLYNNRGQFFWLVETDEGWWRAEAMTSWPDAPRLGDEKVRLESLDFHKLYDYEATVTWAAGAFNWRVAVGDRMHVYEYARGTTTRLAAELSGDELTWSKSTRVANDQLNAWFGRKAAPVGALAGASGDAAAARKFLAWLFALNAVPLVFNFMATFAFLALATILIFLLPAILQETE